MRKLLVVSILALSLMVSPCFAIEYCKDVLEPNNYGGLASLKTWDDELIIRVVGELVIDFWINDVPEPLITAGLWIVYDAAQMNVFTASINEDWDPVMWQTVYEPQGPGTYMLTVGNLSGVPPDSDGDIAIASISFKCLESCAGEITVSVIPNFDTVVGNSASVYDSQIAPNTFSFEPSTTSTTTTTISSCDGTEDICVRIENGSGAPGSTDNPVELTKENLTVEGMEIFELQICDEGNYLTCPSCTYETEEGCILQLPLTGVVGGSGVGDISTSTLYYDVSPDAPPGQCIPIKAIVSDYGEPPLKLGAEHGSFCIEYPSTTTTTTTIIPACDGSENVCIKVGTGSGPPGSTGNSVPVVIENLSDMNVRGYQFNVCDAGDYLTSTNAFEHSSGCASILSYSAFDYLIEAGGTLNSDLLYDVKAEVLPGWCAPLVITYAVAADDSRPVQPLNVAVMPGKFCIECPSEQIYGADSEEVELLRSLRDKILNRTPEGQELIQLYYQWSPVIGKAIKEDEAFKAQLKEMIDEILPMIEILVE